MKCYFYYAGKKVEYTTRAKTFFGLLRARRIALQRAEKEFAEYCERCEFEELCTISER